MGNITTVNVYKAQRLTPIDGETPSVVIRIEAEVPEDRPPWTFSEDAAKLASALHWVLPQGTWSCFVAEVARLWAADQQGIVNTARMHGRDEGPGEEGA